MPGHGITFPLSNLEGDAFNITDASGNDRLLIRSFDAAASADGISDTMDWSKRELESTREWMACKARISSGTLADPLIAHDTWLETAERLEKRPSAGSGSSRRSPDLIAILIAGGWRGGGGGVWGEGGGWGGVGGGGGGGGGGATPTCFSFETNTSLARISVFFGGRRISEFERKAAPLGPTTSVSWMMSRSAFSTR